MGDRGMGCWGSIRWVEYEGDLVTWMGGWVDGWLSACNLQLPCIELANPLEVEQP